MTGPTLPRTAHVIVTGGTGYIGACVVRQALAAGCPVTVLARTARSIPGRARHQPWQLGQPLPASALLPASPPGAQAVIHLAHDWTNPADEDGGAGLNLAGARVLLDSSRQHGVGRFVFVSSQSARPDAANIYGRVKWRVEQLLDRPDEVAARVGLVYGGPKQAMFGLLYRLVEKAPALPMIDPWRRVQPIHLEEVARGLLLIADRGGAGWMGLAAPEGVAFGDFLKTLALEYAGKSLPVVPVPLRAALLACDAASAVPFAPKVDRERILGLAGTQPMTCAEHLHALGLTLMPLAEGLRAEPAGRKALLREGKLLMSYVLRAQPSGELLRRYARAVIRRREGPVALPGSLRAVPAFLRVREPLSGTTSLGRRLRLASALVESSPEGEAQLRAGSRQGRLASIGAQVSLDAAMLLLRLVLGLRRK